MFWNKLADSSATGGAAGFSALASAVGLCCVGPWSVALFGVPGAVMLSRLEPYRPLILLTAGGLLAWAFWRVYRQPANCEGRACERRSSPLLKGALWSSAILLLVAVFARDLQQLVIETQLTGVAQ